MRTRLTGLKAWRAQRVSALYMLLFVLFLLYSFGLHPLHAYPQWKAWMARPGMTVAVLVFFLALLTHMWVGLRDVLLDYAKPASLRRSLLAARHGSPRLARAGHLVAVDPAAAANLN